MGAKMQIRLGQLHRSALAHYLLAKVLRDMLIMGQALVEV